ncbi:diguanylate cyclase (GGDEF) domain-containing protein [Lachnospiraceae bacterium XBB1006]|nr:diguanylate cyclase (GGDEF) domain-containing protein [Lachnospiraceae bacterium XBB1006]
MKNYEYIIKHLEKAIREGDITVYYQPIVRTPNGLVCSEEALSRWNDPVMGMIPAKDFVPALEGANLIYKLDLFVVDEVIRKMKVLESKGHYVVPQSVNLSWADFFARDILSEIEERLDSAGIPREKLIIEIMESTLAEDVETMTAEVKRMKEHGFTVWMDDYGSGYSSPMLLQSVPFDLIKIDKEFIRKIEDGNRSRVIITEIVKMVMALGMDAIAEGVENEEQVEFLKDIGCSMLQGNYYCPPISLPKLLERYEKGEQIGFENPSEADYYAQIGKVDFYSLAALRHQGASLNNFFDTWPMIMLEYKDKHVSIMRYNREFKKFAKCHFTKEIWDMKIDVSDYRERAGVYTLKAIEKCAMDGKEVVLDDRTRNGLNLQLLVWRVAKNSNNQASAVMVVVLSAMDALVSRNSLTYNYIARALSEDYSYLYFVNLDTNEFIEYRGDGANRDVTEERRGDDFFKESLQRAPEIIYKEDVEEFFRVFQKENIVKSLEKNGSFIHTYRNYMDGEVVYVTMKIIKVRDGQNHIIIGINNVDAQMKQKEAFERVKAERQAFVRVAALTGDFMAMYSVDPESGAFFEFNSTQEFKSVGALTEGSDFYGASRKNAKKVVVREDQEYFFKRFKEEVIKEEIAEKGKFTMQYRLLVEGRPVHILLRAAMVQEKGANRIIVGVLNVDDEVKRQEEYDRALCAVTAEANIDELTGVKRKLPYMELEEELNVRIKTDKTLEFAVVVFDINGLKEINDKYGHQAGDRHIIAGCKLICNTFKYSPVFRVGGDEFAVVAQGKDYQQIDALMEQIAEINRQHKERGEVVVAAGMARFHNDKRVAEVFDRADEIMYRNKKELKNS